MVFVSEADPLSSGIPNVHMRATAERTRRERRYNVPRVEIDLYMGRVDVQDHPLPMPRAILPIGGGILRAENEGDLPRPRVECNNPAAGAIAGPVELFHLASRNVDHLDGLTPEGGALAVGASVVHDPLAVR